MPEIADRKTAELEEALWQASEQGRYPVLCDQSPCLHRMEHKIKKMRLYEPSEFILGFLDCSVLSCLFTGWYLWIIFSIFDIWNR